jgi:hypothetical protein
METSNIEDRTQNIEVPAIRRSMFDVQRSMFALAKGAA